jgi:hypothetical protein
MKIQLEPRKQVPEHYEHIGDGMSNFDHVIEPWVEDRLKNEQVYITYPAQNFRAMVWWQDGQFYAEVWQYHNHIDTISESSCRDIMINLSNSYGSE